MVGVVELVAVLGTWRVRTSHGTSVMRESQELSRQGRAEQLVLWMSLTQVGVQVEAGRV